jgi:serine/threonine protein kinase
MISTKNIDSIPYRIEFIKELVGGGEIEPMIEYDHCETEKMIIHKNHDKNIPCTDIRCMLNKKTYNFQKIITQIGGKLLYIKSGTTGHTFKGIYNNSNKSINYAVKIVAYPKKEKYGNPFYSKRPENAELLLIKLLSYFVINKQTPHIVLPIGTFNTTMEPFLGLAKNGIIQNKKYDLFVKKVKDGEYYDEVSVLISEWANGGDLLDYIKKNYKTMKSLDWKIIFFQILAALAVIQKKYDTFRHNDLKANNILVQLIGRTNSSNNKFKYDINDQEYIIPNIGLQIKIWDFDFATIPGLVDNAKVEAEWTNRINVKPKKNRYYDIHYFFNTLTANGFFPEFLKSSHIPKSAKEFIKRVIPDKYATGKYVTDRGRIKINKEYTTPDKLLKTDTYFSKFRINNNIQQNINYDSSPEK